jgi:cytoskeletal protein CcmA (bactofilin family)
LVLPEQTLVLLEIYALETLRGGVESVYRALLGERDLYLARGTTVLRWLHSEGDTHVERGSTLYGRASAGHLLHLAQCCRFQRLHAPRIEFGTLPALPPPAPARLPLKPLILPDIVEVAGRRWLVKGDLEIPPGSSFDGDLVVKGRLFVGSGSRITGSLKSHKQMVIGRGSHVAGSAVSSHSLFIGAACRVKGPLIAEQEVVVAAGSRLGAWDQPTTMTAPHIRVAPSVVVFGTVWAQVSGYVCSEESMAPFLHP